MQKTITINGKKYTGKQIAKMMDASNVTDDSGLVKWVEFGKVKILGATYPLEYICEYRHVDNDGYFAPIQKHQHEANAIRIECRTFEDGDAWLSL